MANPFKEAAKASKVAPGSKKEAPEKREEVVKVETPVEPEKPAEVPQNPITAKTETKPKAKAAGKTEKKEEKPAADIFAGLATEKFSGKTYSFYLSDENANKLKKKAEKLGISTSKLLEHILSEVL